jgi:hypothetical protein
MMADRIGLPTPGAPLPALRKRSAFALAHMSASTLPPVPPTCRRRLTFSQNDEVYTVPVPVPTPDDHDMLRTAIAEVGMSALSADATLRADAWRTVTILLSDHALENTFRESGLRSSLAAVFKGIGRDAEAAAAALAVVAQTYTCDPDDPADRAVCSAVMDWLARGCAPASSFETVVLAVTAYRWDAVFPMVLHERRNAILRQAFGMLDSPDLDVYAWRAVMVLVRIMFGICDDHPSTAEVQVKDTIIASDMTGETNRKPAVPPKQNLREEVIGKRENKKVHGAFLPDSRLLSSEGDTKTDGSPRVRESDVRVMLRAAERLGRLKQHGDATEDALLTLCAVARSSLEAASILVLEQGAAVVTELATAHRSKCSLQAAAVELLATMASPDVFYLIMTL